MTRRRQQERSSETQGKLLDATIACLVERGYAHTSTTEVCQRAGLSRGAQLHHYPTRARLVAAAVEHLFNRRHEEFRAWLSRSRNLEQALSSLWQIYGSGTIHAWMELLVASRTDPELSALLRQVDDRFFAEATETCRHLLGLVDSPGREVAALTRLILSVYDGLALNHTLGGREQVTRDVQDLLARLLERTPLAPAPQATRPASPRPRRAPRPRTAR